MAKKPGRTRGRMRPRGTMPLDPSVHRTALRWDFANRIIGKLASWKVTAPLAFVGGLYVLSGQVTLADISLSLPKCHITLFGMELEWWMVSATVFALVVIVCAIVLAVNRAKFWKNKKVPYLAARNSELEGQIDPGRKSSNLTPTGDTNPEDIR